MGLFDKWKKEIHNLTEQAKKDLNPKDEHVAINEPYRITRNRDGSFNFGKNRVTRLVKNTFGEEFSKDEIKQLLNINFSNSSIHWLFDAEWDAEEIQMECELTKDPMLAELLALETQKENISSAKKKSYPKIYVKNFFGNYKNGRFIEDMSERWPGRGRFNGEFHGTEFSGWFMWPNKAFQATPKSFISGFFSSQNSNGEEAINSWLNPQSGWDGCLGLPSLHKLNHSHSRFHLIQVPIFYTLELTSEYNKIYYLRIEESPFQIKEKEYSSGKTGTHFRLRNIGRDKNDTELDWETVRKQYDNYEITLGKDFRIGTNIYIPKIKEIKFGYSNFDQLDYTSKSKEVEDRLQYFGESIDFSELPIFGPEQIFTFDVFDTSEIETLSVLCASIRNKKFLTRLNTVQKHIAAGYAPGYGKYSHLKKWFDDKPGEGTGKEREESKQIYNFINDLHFLVNCTQGKENRALLFNKFKELLFNPYHDSVTKINNTGALKNFNLNIDFSKESRLGIETALNFSFNSKEEFNKALKLKHDIEDGRFYLTLTQTQRLIENGEIRGFNEKLQLSCFFKEPGDLEPALSPKAINCLEYLAELKETLVDNIDPKEDSNKLITIVKLILSDNY